MTREAGDEGYGATDDDSCEDGEDDKVLSLNELMYSAHSFHAISFPGKLIHFRRYFHFRLSIVAQCKFPFRPSASITLSCVFL